MKKFFKDNILIIAYFVIVTLIELFGVLVTSGKFYIRSPWLFLLIQAIFICILFLITNNKARHIVASILLCVFMIVNLIFIVIFEMTETLFDYGMLNLRNDGMNILERVPINFLFFSVSTLMIAVFIVFGARYVKHAPKKVGYKATKIVLPIVLSVVLLSNCLLLYFKNKDFQEDVQAKLYRSSEASYCELGITANFVNEMFKGTFFMGVDLGDEQELETFIYSDVYNSKFSNNAGNYNLVTILVESFEWTSFMQDFDLFVNGHKIINPETNQAYTDNEANKVLAELYPNIYDFYKANISLTNFYSREKTDIAENLSLMGSYPTNAYINYDFPKNNMATSMPNVLKSLYGDDVKTQAFHNGSYTYYNRNEELISIGFDSYTASDQMYEKGMTDHAGKGERNLDTEMIKVSANEMFPTDSRFYTHITTITMHGQYTYRKNLDEQGYYDEMAEYGIKAMSGSSVEAQNHNNFYYYAACVKEFDKALGEIMNQLEERSLLDNTILLLFGDHNTYYSSLSNYVKNIDNFNDDNYTNLYRVPCMIYYPNIDEIITYLETNQSDKIGSRFVITEQLNSKNETVKGIQVKKFTCTADIVPTLMDLQGINYYENFYFGHSIFDDTVSVLYSRAYDIFLTDSMYFVSLNNIKWIRESYFANNPANKYADLEYYDVEDHINAVEIEATILLKKLDTCNRIFYNDYFARKNINNSTLNNAQIFESNIQLINPNF